VRSNSKLAIAGGLERVRFGARFPPVSPVPRTARRFSVTETGRPHAFSGESRGTLVSRIHRMKRGPII